MKALSNRQQVSVQDQIVKHLCFNCLPMLLILLLLVWLSFGLPHPTWELLLKVIFQFSTFMATWGIAFLVPLAILVAQSVFLLGAWGILIWCIIHEVHILLLLYAKLSSHAPLPSAIATPAPRPAVDVHVPQPAMDTSTALYSYELPSISISAEGHPSQQSLMLQNPFDEEEDNLPMQLTGIAMQFTPPDIGGDIPALPTIPLDYKQGFPNQTINEQFSSSPYAFDELIAAKTPRPPAKISQDEHKPIEKAEGTLYEKILNDIAASQPLKSPSTSIQRRSSGEQAEQPELQAASQPLKSPSTSIQRRSSGEQAEQPELHSATDTPLEQLRKLLEQESRLKASYSQPSPVVENSPEISDKAEQSNNIEANNIEYIEPMSVKEVSPPLISPKKREKQTDDLSSFVPPQSNPFEVVESDPFAVKDEVLNVFEKEPTQEDVFEEEAIQEDAFEEEAIQEKEEQAAPEEDSVFVFGNPFDGPIPDIFMEDEDLKRSVLEQQAGEDNSPHRAGKKEGQKPTGIRKRS